MMEKRLGFDCLLVKPKWGELILSGKKTAEIRGFGVSFSRWFPNGFDGEKKKPRIGLVFSGTDCCFGEVTIDRSTIIETEADWEALRKRHCVDKKFSEVPYKDVSAWLLTDAVRYEKPIKVERKRGQVVWIKNPMVLD